MRLLPYQTLCRVCLAAASFSLPVAHAQPASDFSLTPAEDKQLAIERIYRFYVMDYDPPVPVNLDVSAPSGPFRLPEQAAQAALISRARGNWEGYLNIVSERLRRRLTSNLERSLESFNRSRERLDGRRVELVRQMHFRRFKVIRYRVLSADGGSESVGDIAIAQRRDNASVLHVVDPGNDIVYKEWNFEGQEKRLRSSVGFWSAEQE